MVFCTNCGKENENESQFCSNCGTELNSSSEAGKNINSEPNKVSVNHLANSTGQKVEEKKHKSPIVYALLNIIIAGLGMALVGEYVKALVSFIIVVIAAILGGFVLGFIALIFVMAWTAHEAREYNRRVDESNLGIAV
jgi:Predicted membrane protein